MADVFHFCFSIDLIFVSGCRYFSGRTATPDFYQQLMTFDQELIYENIKYRFKVFKSGPGLWHLQQNDVRFAQYHIRALDSCFEF